MNNIGKIFAWGCGGILLIGVGLPMMVGSCSRERAGATNMTQEQVAQFTSSVLSKVPSLAQEAHVTFETVDETREISTKVEFDKPVPPYHAEVIGKKITQAVIDTLLANGHNPRTSSIYIFTWVQARAGKGATGSQLFIPYGSAIYHPANDQIVFDPK